MIERLPKPFQDLLQQVNISWDEQSEDPEAVIHALKCLCLLNESQTIEVDDNTDYYG